MAVKRAGGSVPAALRVLLLSHSASFLVLLAILHFHGDPFPRGLPLYAGLAAGVFGGFSLAAFYIALSRGAMGASAAVSGVLAAAIPAIVSSFTEGSPGPRRLLGFAIAAAAIWLIAAGPGQKEARSTTVLAIAAGAGFGFYFTALKLASPAGLLWPMANARMGSLTTCALLLLILPRAKSPISFTRQTVLWALSPPPFSTPPAISCSSLPPAPAGWISLPSSPPFIRPPPSCWPAGSSKKGSPPRQTHGHGHSSRGSSPHLPLNTLAILSLKRSEVYGPGFTSDSRGHYVKL